MDPKAAMFNYGGAASGSCLGHSNAQLNLAEIWPFPVIPGGAMSYALVPPATNMNAVAIHDPLVLDRRVNQSACRARKPQEDDNKSAKRGASDSGNGMSEGDNKRLKTGGPNNKPKPEEVEGTSGRQEERTEKPIEPPKDYIHVRARRGQATDSHSLAERARREKISERMRILQDLVPGCNKVIGKALVLDEIINYIQSLQNQVEFLSMKLETLDSTIPSRIEGVPSKDFPQQAADTAGLAFGSQPFTAGLAFGSQPKREYPNGTSPDWLHMQIGGCGFQRTT
ncbi:unnamed protein product [Cuscuta epithymum]|uniref:BHLH domain-containing protein n=1 Tax=Cuscuta epithymum TaxID=186058 RepID=A0AAV0GFI7_9ASTE|nr:unnamed protein product [Cuscuta epithymum]